MFPSLPRTLTGRRYLYAVTAGVLSTSAPAGLIGMRLARKSEESEPQRGVRSEMPGDRVASVYLAAATAAIFAAFGYAAGTPSRPPRGAVGNGFADGPAERAGVRRPAPGRTQASDPLPRATHADVSRSRWVEEHQRSLRASSRQRRAGARGRRDSVGASRVRFRCPLGRRRVHGPRTEHASTGSSDTRRADSQQGRRSPPPVYDHRIHRHRIALGKRQQQAARRRGHHASR